MQRIISFSLYSYFGMVTSIFGLLAAIAPTAISAEIDRDFLLRSWDRRDGLPATLITQIQRSTNGYLWLATGRGLVRFDGARFKLLDVKDSLKVQTNYVSSLLADTDDGLWVGTAEGLFYFPDGRTASARSVETATRLPIKALASGTQGVFWALSASNDVMQIFKGKVLNSFKISGAQPMRSVVNGQQGNLIFVSPYEAVLFKNGQQIKLPPEIITKIKPDTIYPKHKGGFWVAFGSEIADLDESGKEFILTWHEKTGEFPQSIISVLMEDRAGRLWAGTRLGAVHCFQEGIGWRQVTPMRSRALGGISCLYEDSEGLIWAGTVAGNLHQIRPRLVTSWPLPIVAQDGVPQTVCVAYDGSVWIGTDSAGVFRYKNKIFSRFGAEQGLSNATVISIFEDRQTNLWFGTLGGLFRLDAGRLKPELESILKGQPVPSLFQDKAGDLWFGLTGAVIRKHRDEVRTYDLGSAFRDNEVRAIAQGKNDEMWFGVYGGGLFRLQDDQILRQERFTRPVVQTMYYDNQNALWIGTTARGLFRVKGNSIRNWTKKDGLPSDWVHSILEDSEGTLWVNSNEGVFGVKKRALMEKVRNRKSPLLTIQVASSEIENWSAGSGQPAAAKGPDGKLWFPMGHGVLSFNPAELMRDRASLPVMVEEVLVDGIEQAFNGAEPVKTYSGLRRLEFRYTIADLDSPGRLKFRYKLEGVDDNWVDGGATRTASYGLLPPGKYRFRVISAGSGDVWTETANPLVLEIVPHFWQTGWFRGLSILLVLSVVGTTVHFVERIKMRRTLERLEMQQATEKERRRIAQDLHDDLGSGITEIMLLSELAKNGSADENSTKLDDITLKARQVATAMDEIVWTVNPKNDSLPDLASYICDYAQEFFRPSKVSCRIDMMEGLPSLPVTAQQRHNLFMAVKEALNNAVKYSGAKEVWVRIRWAVDQVSIAVEDDGCGFNPMLAYDNGSGNGLQNMHTRLKTIGGKTELTSHPGSGTTICFILPLGSALGLTTESLN